MNCLEELQPGCLVRNTTMAIYSIIKKPDIVRLNVNYDFTHLASSIANVWEERVSNAVFESIYDKYKCVYVLVIKLRNTKYNLCAPYINSW